MLWLVLFFSPFKGLKKSIRNNSSSKSVYLLFVLIPSDHCDGRDVDGVQTLQSLPGNAQEPQTKISRGEIIIILQKKETFKRLYFYVASQTAHKLLTNTPFRPRQFHGCAGLSAQFRTTFLLFQQTENWPEKKWFQVWHQLVEKVYGSGLRCWKTLVGPPGF